MAVSKEVPDFQAGGHRAHDLDVVGAHPHLEEDLVHLLLGVVDAILFASDPKESLDSDMLVADAVPRPRVLWSRACAPRALHGSDERQQLESCAQGIP